MFEHLAELEENVHVVLEDHFVGLELVVHVCQKVLQLLDA